MNNLQLAWSMLISPSAAFAALRERPRFWFPLITLSVATVGVLIWYYGTVDFEWFKENFLGASLQNLPEQQRNRALAILSRKTILWSSVGTGAIAMPIALAMQSVYYLLAGKIVGVSDTFARWFSMMCWSYLPTLIGVIISAAVLAMHGVNAQLSPNELSLLSLNELLFQREFGASGYTLLTSLGVLNVWIWGLRIIGVRVWYGKSWSFSAIFVLLPMAVFYGIWAWLAFR